MPLIAGERTGMVGGYTLVRPVTVGVRESVWSAVDASGSACTLEICERFDDSIESGAALDGFVERASLLSRVASAGGAAPGLGSGHAAAVRGLEAFAFGAAFARDEYGLSGRDLVTGKVRLRGDALHEIVSGVLGALGLFGTHAVRPHGALRAEALLVSGDTPGRLRIGLRAPATAAELAGQADPAQEEMRRLGLLLFELVLHRPFREMGGYPVRDGAEWRALGKHASFWLGLVNELLEPSGTRLTLEKVAARVSGLPFRADGPGAGVWLVRAGVAAATLAAVGAGVWFVFRPGVEPIRADFVEARFERWLRITPLVASLRDGLGEPGAMPPAVVGALDRLALSDDDRERMKLDDAFDVPSAFRSAGLYKSFERTFDNPLPDLLGDVSEFVSSEVQAQAGAEEKTEDQIRLETLAGVFERGLTAFDGAEDDPGFLGSLSPGAWEARGLVAGMSDADGMGWLDASASSLFADVTARLDGSIASFASGAAGADFERATGEDPLAGGRLPAADEFFDAARQVEAAAGVVGAWRDELYPAIETGGASIAAAAAWPADAGSVASRLPGPGDPLLLSFAELSGRVGVVAAGERVEDLDRRLREADAVVKRLAGWLESGWSAETVDLLELASWTETARARIEASPAGSDADSVAAWVDARLQLGGEWLEAARGAGVIEASSWAVTGFDLDIEGSRALWLEAVAEAPDETRDAEIEIAGGSGVIEPRLDEAERRLSDLRALPRWESLEEQARREREAIRALFEGVAADIESVYNEVLMPPRELIAVWRGASVDVPAFEGSGALVSARERIGERLIGSWESWAGGRPDEAIKREAETDALRVGLRGVDRAVASAGERVAALLGQERSYGGFDRGAIDARVGVWLAARAAEVLEQEQAWGTDGATVDAALDGAAFGDTLSQIDRRLGEVRAASGAIARAAVGGDAPGGVLSEPALRASSAFFSDGVASELLAIEEIGAAVSAIDGLLAIEAIDDTGRLLDAFGAEAGAPGRAGIGVAAVLRLDELAAGGGAWPSSSSDLGRDRVVLSAGAVALRGALGEADWDRVTPRIRAIIEAWWLRGVGLAGDRSAFARAVDGASGWFDGVGGEWSGMLGGHLLSGRARYNAGTVEIRSAIGAAADAALAEAAGADRGAIPAIDRRLLDTVTARLDELDRLAAETLTDREREASLGWVGAFRGALREARQGRRGWDADDFGPVGAGLPGWRAELDEDAEPPIVRYIKDGGPSLAFRLVGDLPDGGQVFLSVDEVSVGVCAEIMRYGSSSLGSAIGDWYEVFDDNPRNMQFRGDLLEGPAARDPFVRGRNDTRHRLAPARRWLTGSEYGPPVEKASYPAYPEGLGASGEADAIADSQGGGPDEFCPVNYIPPRLAREAAAAFGCRLPTVAEFGAALARVPAVGSGRWNLRDGSFSRQYAHYEAALAFGVTHYQPGKWSYDGRESVRDEVWSVPGTADDRLWFYRASGSGTTDDAFGDGALFRHLVGNVAEYVLEGESSSEVRVMGASALSDPSVGPSDVRPVTGPTRGTNGFVDVGFRLAIDADDFGSLGKMVLKQLAASESASFASGGG